MAGAMVDGLITSNALAPQDIVCYSPSGKSAGALADRTGIRQAHSLAELMDTAGILIVAFKPYHLDSVDQELVKRSSGKLIVSVLSGKRIVSLARAFPNARNIVRTMPNTPSQIGAGVTPWCSQNKLTTEDRTALDTLLSAMGRHLEIAESSMDAATAVSGSGAGFVFEFAGALREAAEQAGLDAETAHTLAIETLLGSARLLARSKDSPEVLRDKVTSPNGTTFAGLSHLQAGDFRGLIRGTIEAAKKRAVEISQDA